MVKAFLLLATRTLWLLLLVLMSTQTTSAFQGHDRQPVFGRRRTAPPLSQLVRHPLSMSSSTTRLRVSLEDTTSSKDEAALNGEASTTSTTTTPATSIIQQQQPQPEGYWCYWSTGYELVQAGLVGAITGLCVACFKLSIESVRSLTYEQELLQLHPLLIALIPALGGVVVGVLLLAGKGKAFPPGLRGTVQETDEQKPNVPLDFLRKSTASVATLGTGNSLGPEGPCVEIGLNVARACTSLNRPVPSREAASTLSPDETLLLLQQQSQFTTTPSTESQRQWNRVLLSCGAAAGVAAGFNAPIAGVFFALEIMQNTFKDVDQDQATAATAALQEGSTNTANLPNLPNLPLSSLASMTDTTTITPILISSVLSALLSQFLLGNHLILTLTDFDLATPLVELPLYLLLGALSGVVAFVFTYSAKISQQVFAGDFAPMPAVMKQVMTAIPDAVKPVMGGLLCGLVGLVFPQILFFGYETLNSLLKDNGELSLSLILSLMGVKTLMTAIAAGSGLVGGTFAPSLFLGGMLGCAFHEVANNLLESAMHLKVIVDSSPAAVTTTTAATLDVEAVVQGLESAVHIAGVPAYAMVGAAR